MSKQNRSFITYGVTEVLVDVRVFHVEVVNSLNEELTLAWSKGPLRNIAASRVGDAIEVSDGASIAARLPHGIASRLSAPLLTIGVPRCYEGRVAVKAASGSVSVEALGANCEVAVSVASGRVSFAGCALRDIDVESDLGEVELLSCHASGSIAVETNFGNVFCYLLGGKDCYTANVCTDRIGSPLNASAGDGPVPVSIMSRRGKVALRFGDHDVLRHEQIEMSRLIEFS